MERFARLERLGQGSLGEVWRARDPRSGDEVALRVIPEPNATLANALVAVARRAAAIHDPRVVGVRDAGRNGDEVWVAMELVRGRTLRQVLEEEGPFGAERLVDVACQLCAALDAGMRHGLQHRDLKPGSVMLTGDGAVKVMDFGLAHARALRATGRYAAPESRYGYPVDERADLYSLGVLLVELATGSEYRDFEDEGDAPTIAAAQLPPAVTAVMLRLLHKDAGARFRTPSAVAEALRRALPRPSMVVQQVAQRKRRRRGAILGAALALVGVAGLAYFTRGRGEALGTASFGCQIVVPPASR